MKSWLSLPKMKWGHLAPPALLCLALFGSQVAAPPALLAQGSSAQSVSGDTKFIVRVNLKALNETSFGSKLMAMAKEGAMAELKKQAGSDANPDKLMEAIGFDPFEEIQSVTLSASDFEHPEESMVATIQLRKNSGNLEGLVLGLPGYSETKYKSHTIHSAAPDQDKKVYGALHADSAGNKRLLISASRKKLEEILDENSTAPVSASDRGSRSEETTEVRISGSSILSVRILGLPEELGKFFKGGPQANITKMLKSLALDLSGSDEDMLVQLSMSTEKEEQAEQVRQMLQGLIALLEFAQTADTNDRELEELKKYAKGLKTTREGSNIRVEAKVPTDELTEVLERELGRRIR